MVLPTLTWTSPAESLIKASTPNYSDFLNAIETKINASTHWKINKKTLDAGNSRGFLEIAPKSTLAGVTEGRILFLFSTGTVAGASGAERPLKACRIAPYDGQDTNLLCKMWAGFSPDANSSTSGPANDPWTSATPYGATPLWSGLATVNSTYPVANSMLGLIESAEGLALYWTAASGNEINGLVMGRMMETLDGNTGYWMLHCLQSCTDNNFGTAGWYIQPGGLTAPPLGYSMYSQSLDTNVRPWTLVFKGNVLYGVGRNWETGAQGGANAHGYSGVDGALLQAIILAGGTYFGGPAGYFQGIFRQVRWGPAAQRKQKLYSSGVEQAICLHYATASTGPQDYGFWFHHFRS